MTKRIPTPERINAPAIARLALFIAIILKNTSIATIETTLGCVRVEARHQNLLALDFGLCISLPILRPVEHLSSDEVRKAVQSALAEDLGNGDATTLSTIPPETIARGVMRAREPMVLAGIA